MTVVPTAPYTPTVSAEWGTAVVDGWNVSFPVRVSVTTDPAGGPLPAGVRLSPFSGVVEEFTLQQVLVDGADRPEAIVPPTWSSYTTAIDIPAGSTLTLVLDRALDDEVTSPWAQPYVRLHDDWYRRVEGGTTEVQGPAATPAG